MVDAAIVMIENAHKNLAHKPVYTEYERRETILKSAQQVGAPVFFALIIIVTYIDVCRCTQEYKYNLIHGRIIY